MILRRQISQQLAKTNTFRVFSSLKLTFFWYVEKVECCFFRNTTYFDYVNL